jgi:carboxypeptidase Q
MRSINGVLALAMTASLSTRALAADDTIARIVGHAMTRGGASAFLERLTDTVGGRVTGSRECRAAAELIRVELESAGYANARFEEYPLASRWARGPATGRIVAPIDRPITLGSMAWVPGTAGAITVPLVDIGAPPSNEWMPPAARVRGAAVLVDLRRIGDDPAIVMRTLIARKLAEAGAAAMLLPSDKPNRMVYTSAFGFYPKGPLPVVSVAKEDTLLLRRLLARGPVSLALDVKNSFDTRPYQERNVMADLPGTDLKHEVVLIGAHYDSWDPAEGANDDGSGVAAVLDVARILKALNLSPRRTIRFAFFSGEEQALLGSRAYVATHEAELDGLRAVIIMDSGAQAPLGWQIHGRTDLAAAVARLAAPLAPLGAAGVFPEADFDEDCAPFVVAGVPALFLRVEEGDYDIHHHAISDTFDKVDPRMLAIDTAVMGIAAYTIADAAEPPGRRLSAAETSELMKKTGVLGTKQIVYRPLP